MTILITFSAKHATLIRRSIVLSLPFKSVLPALMDRWTDRQRETRLVNSFIEREKIILLFLLLSKTDVYILRERNENTLRPFFSISIPGTEPLNSRYVSECFATPMLQPLANRHHVHAMKNNRYPITFKVIGYWIMAQIE